MDGLSQYVLSVIVAALICGVLSGILQNSAYKELMRLLCGILMTITVLDPLIDLDFQVLPELAESVSEESHEAVTAGTNISRESLSEIIKQKTEAYILDKAAEMGAKANVTVYVSAEDIPVPVYVEMSGAFSPYARQGLIRFLETDLGISKENQKWTG